MHLVIAFAVLAGPAAAAATMPGFMEAPRLVALCNATGPDAESGRSLCLGYIVGSLDQLLARQAASGVRTVCPPADLTVRRALGVVMHQSEFAEGAKGTSAASLVQFALERAYPCRAEPDRPWRSPNDRRRDLERTRIDAPIA